MSGIEKWNTSNVENMDRMFKNATSFSNDLSPWPVDKIEERPVEFADGIAEGQMVEPIWRTKETTPPEEKPIDPVDPPEEKPTEPEVDPPEEVDPPNNGGNGSGETTPTDPEPPEEKPEAPTEPSKPESNNSDCQCYADGSTDKDFPAIPTDDLIDLIAERRITCFEDHPSVMKPIKPKKDTR